MSTHACNVNVVLQSSALQTSPSSEIQTNPHLMPLPLHNPDGRLAERWSGVRLLSRRLQVWGEILLPHRGWQWGVWVPLAVCICLLLHPLHLSGHFILRNGFLERRGGVGDCSGPWEALLFRQCSLWSPSMSEFPMVSKEDFSVHVLFGETVFWSKVILLMMLMVYDLFQSFQPDKYKYLEYILLKGTLKGGRWRKLTHCWTKIFSKKSKISKNKNKTKK